MTTQVNTKVRLVRCPKCRQVLAELPDVLLYQCGGCGTVLQAKKRNLEKNQCELTAEDSDSVAKSQEDNVSEEKESRISNHDSISQHEPSVSDYISSSPEITSRSDKDSPSQVIEPMKHEEREEKALCQTSDTKFYDHENLHEDEDEDNGLRPRAAYRERMKNNYENRENCVIDQNETISKSIEVDDEIEGLLTDGISGLEKNVSENAEDSKSFVSFYLSSPDDEVSDQKLSQNFERVSSVDTLGSSPLERVSSELDVKHGDVNNFTRIESYYGYDGSESSFDGSDDQIRERISNPSIKIKGSDYISATDRLKKDGLRANDVANPKRETNYWAMKNKDIGGNKTRLDRQGDASRGLRFTSRDVVSCPRTEKPSNCRAHLPRAPPGFRSSVEPVPSSYSQPDNMDLLRTVCELKDQLSRMHFPTNRGPYDPPRHHGWSEQHNVGPRMAFSGEAAHYRQHVNCSCLRCCPRECHYSAQLVSNCVNCRNDHCTVLSEHYTSSEVSLHGCETKIENQRLFLKEKYNTAKRYLRPVTGGAPFVTCHYCLELLQLPADFILFKKRYHQLMCNACKKVLKFSVFKGTHLVPYGNDGSAPLPGNFEPVSCSDDYGRSFGQSCSTSFDKSNEMKSYNRKMSLDSSYEPVEDRKMKSILKDSVETVESVGTSSKIPKWRKTNSEIESSNSPLHRLMGYSSLSQVLKN